MVILTNFAEQIAEDNRTLLNVRDELQEFSVSELQKIADHDRNPFAVCILNLTGDLNTGMIIRSASLFGAEEVIVFGRRKYDKRSTVGSQNYIKVTAVNGNPEKVLGDTSELDVEVFRTLMEERQYLPVFVEQGGRDLTTLNWDWICLEQDRIPCLVFGNEGRGIPADFLQMDYRNFVVSIPQKGVLRSFNVSASANIVMYAMCHQMGWV